jgi:hypothetical protein
VHPRKAGVALTIESRVGFASDWDEELTKICDNLRIDNYFFDFEQVFVSDFLALSHQLDKLDWHSAPESAN